MNWLLRWLERRRLRKVVPWDTCAWSPKKAAEKRFTQHLIAHYQAMAQIQLNAVQRSMLAQIRDGEILRLAARAAADRARADLARQHEIHRARTKQ